MEIAILGATSQIAKDLILSFSKSQDYNFLLFCRNIELLKIWINDKKLGKNYQVQGYSKFSNNDNYDVIINFVGVGDPVRAKKIGIDIFEITEEYDNMALDYIKLHNNTKYIFLSSGAVYGEIFPNPVNKDTLASIDINNLNSSNWYGIAKLYAEAKHRALAHLSIADIRVFNYFSHTQDMNARFFITDIVRAIKNKEVFKTSKENIVRDFITPSDFYNLITAIINHKSVNIALDCYTKNPVSKFDLLDAMQIKYLVDDIDVINATGVKTNYYSKHKAAQEVGYTPQYDSIDGIFQDIKKIR
jgi:nucleoside-diphosphate-sugar epimerase